MLILSFLLSGFLPYFWRAVIGLWGLGENNALEVATQLQKKAKLVLDFINDNGNDDDDDDDDDNDT